MKKIIINLVLLSLSSMSNGMDKLVTLPSQEALESLLEGIGFEDFAEKTNFTEQVGNMTFKRSDLIKKLNGALEEYKEVAFSALNVEKAKPKIIACFLGTTAKES
ncbi:MAG TPA: hypothetical protein VHO47_02680 [Candidatus Babeliales bacterium]|nr:hypothetical protein [Candidatus Babeliales bacterium]